MRRLPPFPGLIALFFLGGVVGTRASAQSEPADVPGTSAVSTEYDRGQVVLQVGQPITLEVGPYDDVISLEPDRLTVTPKGDGTIELLGGPRSGRAAVLVLSGMGAETIVVEVEATSRWQVAEERAAELSRPTYRYRGLVTTASTDVGRPQLSTGHALSVRQNVGDRSWHGEMLLTGQQDWNLQRIALHYAEPGLRMTAGDTSMILATQQLALAVRGGQARLGDDDAYVGLVGGVQRRGGGRTSTGSQLAGLALNAGGNIGQSWADGQVGVITSADQAPRLATRAGVGFRGPIGRGMAEVSTLGNAAAVMVDTRSNSRRADLGARLTWQSNDMTLVQRSRGSRLRADLSAAYRLHSDWTLTAVSVASHQGSDGGELLPATTVMGGIGGRWQPTARTTAQLVWRSGVVSVGDSPATTHGLNGGIRIDPSVRFFGSADAEVQWTRERTALRHNLRVGYGNRYAASVFAVYRGLRQWNDMNRLTSERISIGGRVITGPLDAQVDAGLDHFETPAESGWRPLVSAATQWQVAEPMQLNLSGFHTVARTKDGAPRWRLEAAVQLADSIGGGDGWFGLGGTVTGEVFEDLDGDAVRDPDEPVISGVVMTLDDTRTTRTDKRGRYRFGGVPAGSHTLVADRGTWAAVNGANRTVQLNALGRAVENIALRPGGHIEGRLFVDDDDDRKYDPSEYGYSVPQVELLDDEGTIVDTVACDSGLFRFRGVRAGTWTIRLDLADLPPGVVPLSPLEQTLTLAAGTTTTAEFPLRAMRSVAGTVWVDTNNSGAYDPADYPAPGVWVHLDNGSVARTNANGEYLFRDLDAGRYRAWVRGGKRDRRVRFATDPEEASHVDLFIPEDVFQAETPDALLTIRSTSPVVRAVRGQPIPDPFVAVHDDLSRGTLQPEREWTIADPDVVRVESDRMVAGNAGQTTVDISVDGIPSRSLTVEVTEVPWLDVTTESAVRLDVDTALHPAGVVASVGSTIIPMGERVPLSATAVFSDGTVQRLAQQAEWDVQTDGVVTVSPDGWLEATGVGHAVLTARLGDAESHEVQVEVVPDPIVELMVADEAVRVEVGRAAPLTVTARYGSERRVDMSGAARWFSTRPDILAVNERGTLIALAPGRATVWARIGEIESPSIPIEVRERPIVGVTVTAAPALQVGDDLNAVVTAITSGGLLETPESVRWISDESSVIEVDHTGNPVAVGRGRAQLIAELGGARSAPVEIRVRRRMRRREEP